MRRLEEGTDDEVGHFGLAPIKREGSLFWTDTEIQTEWQGLDPKLQDVIQKWCELYSPKRKKSFYIMPKFLRQPLWPWMDRFLHGRR